MRQCQKQHRTGKSKKCTEKYNIRRKLSFFQRICQHKEHRKDGPEEIHIQFCIDASLI